MIAHLTGTVRAPILSIDGNPSDQRFANLARRFGGRLTKTGVTFSTLKILPMDVMAQFGVTQVHDYLGVGDPNLAYRPLVECDPNGPNRLLIWPRFWGYQVALKRLPNSCTWLTKHGHFVVDAIAPLPMTIAYTPDALDRIAAKRNERIQLADGATEMAAAINMDSLGEAGRSLLESVPDIPDWFGLDLYPYQVAGSAAIVAGRYLLVDEPGLGKTRQALAAAARVESERTLILTPSSHLFGWAINAEEAGFERFGKITVMRGGIKQPAIPQSGVVVIPVSLLASRAELLQDLAHWRPNVVMVDEVHLARNPKTRQARVMAYAANHAATFPIGITGTPFSRSPVELSAILAVTGQITTVFGDRDAMIKRFTTKNKRKFGALEASTKQLRELTEVMSERVWVHRRKADVLPELPEKQRNIAYVDVPLADYRSAYAELQERVAEKLADYLAENGRYPKDTVAWAKQHVGMISPLRTAAGMAKVGVATEWISEFVNGTGRPLVVWAYHNPVLDELHNALEAAGVEHLMYRSSMSPKARAATERQFQTTDVSVIVLSIAAGSVAITLTRSTDALFVEPDWVPDVMTQAEDRIHRIGQNAGHPVSYTTLIAPGTLDPHIHKTLRRKVGVLDVMLPGRDNQVTAFGADEAELADPPRRLISYLANMAIARNTNTPIPPPPWEDL